MATANDVKIKELLKAIEEKREQLGTKPKGNWETNGVINGRNINTINSIDDCIILASDILTKKAACDFLEVELSEINRALNDLKVRVQMIKWEEEKKKLVVMEKKLKDLRSVDAKTEDELADIMASLK